VEVEARWTQAVGLRVWNISVDSLPLKWLRSIAIVKSLLNSSTKSNASAYPIHPRCKSPLSHLTTII